jgi:hypothetical protein
VPAGQIYDKYLNTIKGNRQTPFVHDSRLDEWVAIVRQAETVKTTPFDSLIITPIFDDGLLNAYNNFLPIFNKHNLKISFAVNGEWQIRPARGAGTIYEIMGVNKLKECLANGHEILNHGWSHIQLDWKSTLSRGASAGATTIYSTDWGFSSDNADAEKFIKLQEGATSEINAVLAYQATGIGNERKLTLQSPLAHSYTTSAVIRCDYADEIKKNHEWIRDTFGEEPATLIGMQNYGINPNDTEMPAIYAELAKYYPFARSAASYFSDARKAILHYGQEGYNLPTVFKETVTGWKEVRQQGGWVMWFAHHTDDITPSNLDAFLNYLKRLGVIFMQCRDIVKLYPAKSSFPMLEVSTLNAGVTTSLDSCFKVALVKKTLCLTVEAAYNSSATVGGELYIYTSLDGINYDNVVAETKALNFTAGQTKRETFVPAEVIQKARFLKCTIKNKDSTYAMSNIKLSVTLS